MQSWIGTNKIQNDAIKICLYTKASLKMLSPHGIPDSGTISHNILYIRPHKHKRVVVMTPHRGGEDV